MVLNCFRDYMSLGSHSMAGEDEEFPGARGANGVPEDRGGRFSINWRQLFVQGFILGCWGNWCFILF